MQGGQNFIELCSSLYADGTWVFEPKFNGWRAWLHVPTGLMFNRHNEPLSINDEFKDAAQLIRNEFGLSFSMRGGEWLDVEALERRHGRGQGSLVIIDTPKSEATYSVRSLDMVMRFRSACLDHCATPNTVYSIPSYGDGPALWRELMDINRSLGIVFYEGVVAKRIASTYPIQLRSSKEETKDWVKHRFTTS
jgi:hypothetical protein